MKKCLIVVDYQNDFVDGSLGFPGAELLEGHITDLIRSYRAEGQDVIFTKDTHTDTYLGSQEGRYLPIAHCIKGTKGHDLYGNLESLVEDAPVFEKPTFPSLDLANHLATKDYEEITLVGLVSNICVVSNAIMAKAALPECQIIIDSKGTASHDPETQDACFRMLTHGLQIDVI